MRALSAEKTVKEDPVRLPHWRRRREDRIVLKCRDYIVDRSITRDVATCSSSTTIVRKFSRKAPYRGGRRIRTSAFHERSTIGINSDERFYPISFERDPLSSWKSSDSFGSSSFRQGQRDFLSKIFERSLLQQTLLIIQLIVI